MKIVTIIILSVLSLTAFAHSGHGSGNVFVHGMDHALWILGGLAIFAVIFFLKRRQ